MKIHFVNPSALWVEGISIARVITGLLLIFHGFQIFKPNDMEGYSDWLSSIGIPFSIFAAYAGKLIELIGGLFLVLGLFTRISSAIIMAAFLFITIILGEAKILSDAQYPFLFALLAFIFFCIGPGKWSLDQLLNRDRSLYRRF